MKKSKILGIYSSKHDAVFFALPIVLSFFAMFFFYNSQVNQQHIIYILIFKVLINQWHVFLSLFLTLEHKKIVYFLTEKKWIVLPLCLALPVLGFINTEYFKTMLGYFGLFHVVMQYYGFMRISNKKSNNIINTWISQSLFWSVICVSFVYWFQGQSRVSLSYFFFNNLIKIPIVIPFHYLNLFLSILAIFYFLFSLKSFVANKVFNIGQLYILLIVWIVFYFGLVLSHSNNLFYLLSLSFHGVTYVGHVYYAKKKSNKSIFINNYTNVGVTLVGALTWTLSLIYLKETAILIPFVYFPLILHFIFDGYFWKKNRMADFY